MKWPWVSRKRTDAERDELQARLHRQSESIGWLEGRVGDLRESLADAIGKIPNVDLYADIKDVPSRIEGGIQTAVWLRPETVAVMIKHFKRPLEDRTQKDFIDYAVEQWAIHAREVIMEAVASGSSPSMSIEAIERA